MLGAYANNVVGNFRALIGTVSKIMIADGNIVQTASDKHQRVRNYELTERDRRELHGL